MLSTLVYEQFSSKKKPTTVVLYIGEGFVPWTMHTAHEEKYTVTYTLVCSSQPLRRVENNRRLLVE